MEYLIVQRAPSGGSYRYRLASADQATKRLDGLMAPDELAARWEKRSSRTAQKRDNRDKSGTR